LVAPGTGSIFGSKSQIRRGMEGKYTWKKDYNTGVKFIDEQHRYFLNIIARLGNSIREGICKETASEIFFSLAHYAEHYLIQEEIYFKEANFPGIQEHKDLHAGFIQRIIQFQEDYEKNYTETCKSMLPFLDEWFDTHILKYDSKAVNYLKSKGL
jgi:hemerythrin